MLDLGIKVIILKRIYLRKFNLKDANDLFEFASNENVTRYLTWNPHKSIEETKAYLSNVATKYDQDTYRWAICSKENNKLIGTIDVVRLNKEKEEAEIGYVLNEKYHNHGYMSEAFNGVIDYLFNEVNLKKIKACYQLGNIASKRVMEKCGLKKEHLIKEKTLPLKNNKIVYVEYMAISKYMKIY